MRFCFSVLWTSSPLKYPSTESGINTSSCKQDILVGTNRLNFQDVVLNTAWKHSEALVHNLQAPIVDTLRLWPTNSLRGNVGESRPLPTTCALSHSEAFTSKMLRWTYAIFCDRSDKSVIATTNNIFSLLLTTVINNALPLIFVLLMFKISLGDLDTPKSLYYSYQRNNIADAS